MTEATFCPYINGPCKRAECMAWAKIGSHTEHNPGGYLPGMGGYTQGRDYSVDDYGCLAVRPVLLERREYSIPSVMPK